MRLLFHDTALGLRGTTQAVYDYAHHAERLLGHESVIAYRADHPDTDAQVLAKFAARFPLVPYRDPAELVQAGAELAYVIKSGAHIALPPGLPFVVHEVFQRYDPRGRAYAYVSDWLSQYRSGGRAPWVPHMVDLPPGQSQRAALGIPGDAFVFGRYGGYETFDLPFVHAVVSQLLEAPDTWAVFRNTRPFIAHPRALFLGPVTEPQAKADFIASCDAMLHARRRGESFGMAIAEFLALGKPVLAWRGGKDGNHRVMLRDAPGALYRDGADLVAKAHALRAAPPAVDWAQLVSGYAPDPVMRRFARVFLDPGARLPRAPRIWVNCGYRARRVLQPSR